MLWLHPSLLLPACRAYGFRDGCVGQWSSGISPVGRDACATPCELGRRSDRCWLTRGELDWRCADRHALWRSGTRSVTSRTNVTRTSLVPVGTSASPERSPLRTHTVVSGATRIDAWPLASAAAAGAPFGSVAMTHSQRKPSTLASGIGAGLRSRDGASSDCRSRVGDAAAARSRVVAIGEGASSSSSNVSAATSDSPRTQSRTRIEPAC